MARPLNLLTARTVQTVKGTGRHSDGGGLYLVVTKSGSKNWTFLFDYAGKRREKGLGPYPEIDLGKARARAIAARQQLAEGLNPIDADRKAEAVPEFGIFADSYVEAMRSQWRNEKHIAQWKMTLTKYAAPIRSMPVNKIATDDVLSVLHPLWQRTPETAERLRGRIENVLDAARAKGHRTGENPARWRGHLDQLLPKRQRLTRGHHKALDYDAMPAFMADLRERVALSALALEFAILTAARSGEALNATWAEIDAAKGIWTVPAARTKSGKEHRVPLTVQALAVIAKVKPLNQSDAPNAPLFPGNRKNRPISGMALTKVLERMKVDATIHGFRSSFRDWASETTGFPHEVCEMALAHVIPNKAEAAYRRGDLFEKRRQLMQAWAGFCEPKAGNVIALNQVNA